MQGNNYAPALRDDQTVALWLTGEERTALAAGARELILLDVGVGSWRSEAAVCLTAILRRRGQSDAVMEAPHILTGEELRFIAHAAFELASTEYEGALQRGSVTWRSVIADDLSGIVARVGSNA